MSVDAQPNFWSRLFPWLKPKEPKVDENRWANYRVSVRPSAMGHTYISITDKRTGEQIARDHYTSSKRALTVKWDVQDLISSHEKAKAKAAKKSTDTDKQKAKLRAEGFEVT